VAARVQRATVAATPSLLHKGSVALLVLERAALAASLPRKLLHVPVPSFTEAHLAPTHLSTSTLIPHFGGYHCGIGASRGMNFCLMRIRPDSPSMSG
jgi:hypothetical protein